MPIIIRADYLSYYNPSRNSDKLFNVFLVRNDEGTYSCLTENGRRGSSLVPRIVCEAVRRETAENKFWEKVREKRNHNMTPYQDEPFGTSYSKIAAEFTFDSPPNKEKPPIYPETGTPKNNVIRFPLEKRPQETDQKKQNGILNSGQFDSLEF